jgi:hypothetical protein
MRRRLSIAYLLQTLLVIVLLALLVYLALHGATPLVIALVLLGGAILAALPSILAGGVLPARDSVQAERIRQTGVIASAEVLTDPNDVYTQFKRGLARFRSPQVLVEVPVSVLKKEGAPGYNALMLAPLSMLPKLQRGRVLQVRIDPSNPAYVVLDEDTPTPPASTLTN